MMDRTIVYTAFVASFIVLPVIKGQNGSKNNLESEPDDQKICNYKFFFTNFVEKETLPNQRDIKTLLSGSCNINNTCGIHPADDYRGSPYTYLSYGEKPKDKITTGIWNMDSLDLEGCWGFIFLVKDSKENVVMHKYYNFKDLNRNITLESFSKEFIKFNASAYGEVYTATGILLPTSSFTVQKSTLYLPKNECETTAWHMAVKYYWAMFDKQPKQCTFYNSNAMSNIASDYCQQYKYPSDEYITKNMASQLQEKQCHISVMPPPSSNDSHKGQQITDKSVIYTAVFSCIGFILLVLTIVGIVMFCKRYKTVITVNAKNRPKVFDNI
eukprot:TCONS_00010269-protein